MNQSSKKDMICKISSNCQWACFLCREGVHKNVLEAVFRVFRGHVFNTKCKKWNSKQKLDLWVEVWSESDQFILISFFIACACHHRSLERDTKVHVARLAMSKIYFLMNMVPDLGAKKTISRQQDLLDLSLRHLQMTLMFKVDCDHF